jgi:hypothetical protein
MVLFNVWFENTKVVTIDYVFPNDITQNYTSTQTLEDARRTWKYFMVNLDYTTE